MASYIRVTNPHNHLFWERELSNQELQEAQFYAAQNKQPVRIYPAVFQIVRTNTWMNFAKDLFLPTVINHAIKVEDVVLRVLSVLASLLLDLFTFPIRLASLPICLIENRKKEDHPFYRYLQTNQVDSRIYEAEDYVRVKFGEGHHRDEVNRREAVQEDERHLEHWIERNVNFIRLPMYESAEYESSCIAPPVRRLASDFI